MKRHSAHWGVFDAEWTDGSLKVRPYAGDPDPNPIIDNLPGAIRHRARIAQPAVRRGWLERGPGPDSCRGRDEFVTLPWDEVLDRLAAELSRVKDRFGAEAVFGGSYGWSSAGRFHHAQSQLHRFLNVALGGYVRSVNSYSAGASAVILPHIAGPLDDVARRNVSWEQIVRHTDVVVAFGGMALKNTRVASGGISRHIERDSMREAAARGCRFVNVSPLAGDLPAEANPEWLPVIPGTDTAMMLAMMHTLLVDGLCDHVFIDRYCDGWQPFEDYLLGRSDGQPKSAAWAAPICGIDAETISALARSLGGRRTLIVVAHSLQRAQYGEQPVWAGAVLAAMLGQIGLPGGGYAYALGTLAHYGKRQNLVSFPALPQGRNAVAAFIPVARIADMLLQPGASFDYDGRRHTYPHIRLAYWAGGNPFHHHQDLARLREAFCQLDTFVVHDSAWTATARHADIVLPATMTLERDDVGGTPTDPLLVAMHRIVPRFAEARDDYDIFSDLAARLGVRDAFTEGRDARGWLEHLYATMRAALATKGFEVPDFDAFFAAGELQLPQQPDDGGIQRAFRENPEGRPLPTPSGRLQVSSPVIAGFGYADCPGHPAWIPGDEQPTREFPLLLVSNQPETKLHSQLDFGAYSQGAKRRGREVCTLHPSDATARRIRDGDAVRLFNARGACLACARVSADVRQGVVQLPTGAWYDPGVDAQGRPLCRNGNPNVLTRDVGTSSLAQGCSGILTIVEVERFDGLLPQVTAYEPPVAVALSRRTSCAEARPASACRP